MADNYDPNCHHNVYVVLLNPSVLDEAKFKSANPDYARGKPCLYVGLTGLDPEERWRNHKKGYKSSSIVKKYGLGLVPALYEHLNPMTYPEAKLEEEALAQRLRQQGHAVWQH